MKIYSPFVMRCGGLTICTLTRCLMGTLDYRALYADPTIDPVNEGFYGSGIYLFWHEYIPIPFYLRGHCDFAMLLSRHRDAQWLAHAAGTMGFKTVRGSSYRGGSRALREMREASKGLHLTLTPDGPRGPRRELAPGAIYLASRLDLPLVLMGYGYDRPWRLKTWDQFAIPRPFSRVRAVVSGRLHIPPDLSRDEIEDWRKKIENDLNVVTSEAENWAASGVRYENEHSTRRAPATLENRRRTRAEKQACR